MTDAQKLKILKRTREILARPKGWSKHSFWKVRNKEAEKKSDGEIGARPLSAYNDLDDFSFCIAGAAKRAHSELYRGYIEPADLVAQLSIETLAKAKLANHPVLSQCVAEGDVATFLFNDAASTRKKDVLDLLDEKIAELEDA